MNRAIELNNYFDAKCINVPYDPIRSVYTTRSGREVPVFFDEEYGISYFSKREKEIHLKAKFTIESLANEALHEMGHANASSANSRLTDWTMLPAAGVNIAALVLATITRGDFIALAVMSIPFLYSTLATQKLISDAVADTYSVVKRLQGWKSSRKPK
jgi:hypothetical protein